MEAGNYKEYLNKQKKKENSLKMKMAKAYWSAMSKALKEGSGIKDAMREGLNDARAVKFNDNYY